MGIAMFRSDPRWRCDLPAAAQPAQPLPDLCPTTAALPRMALPNLPNLFGFLAYMCKQQPAASILCMCHQVGQVGQVGLGQLHQWIRVPNLKREGLGRSGSRASSKVLPSRSGCGLHGRENAVVGGFELWFNRGTPGSLIRFTEVAA